MNYEEYLRSPAWKTIRAEVIARDGSCVLCDSTDELQVHHRTYARLGHEEPTDLATLCLRCHRVYHAAADVRKMPISEWRDDLSGGRLATEEEIDEILGTMRKKLGW